MKVAWLVLVAACGDDPVHRLPDGAASDAPVGDAVNLGFVALGSYSTASAKSGSAIAHFASSVYTGCTITQLGACQVTLGTCNATTALSGGAVDITGLGPTIHLTSGSDGQYAPFATTTAALYAGGETVTATVAGDVAPGFTAIVTTPTAATVTSPSDPGVGNKLTVNRASDFTVHWTGGSGKVTVYLTSTGATAYCMYDASAGTGTIPAATVAMLPAGMGGFSVSTLTETEMTTGAWQLLLEAAQNAIFPGDTNLVSVATIIQ